MKPWRSTGRKWGRCRVTWQWRWTPAWGPTSPTRWSRSQIVSRGRSASMETFSWVERTPLAFVPLWHTSGNYTLNLLFHNTKLVCDVYFICDWFKGDVFLVRLSWYVVFMKSLWNIIFLVFRVHAIFYFPYQKMWDSISVSVYCLLQYSTFYILIVKGSLLWLRGWGEVWATNGAVMFFFKAQAVSISIQFAHQLRVSGGGSGAGGREVV